jgi:L-fucose mutarotase
MLKSKLTHPEILAALGRAGHGAQVLIADGNYPFATGANPSAPCVYLNLTRGSAPVDEVLAVLVEAIVVEAAHVMMPSEGPEPPIFGDFRRLLPAGMPLQYLERFAFYDAARGRDVALGIATLALALLVDLLRSVAQLRRRA